MKKLLLSISLSSLSAFSFAQKTDPAPYCKPEYDNQYNMFSALSVGSYTHSFGPAGSISLTNSYLYVDTARIPYLAKGVVTTAFLDMYNPADPEPVYFALWIDYNQDKAFDTSEIVGQNANTVMTKLPTGSSGTVSIPVDINPPASAKLGKTRMRIIRADNPTDALGLYDPSFRLSPCMAKTGDSYGCVYDFDVYITGDPPDNINEQALLQRQLQLAPNPAQAYFGISNQSGQPIRSWSVSDMSGKEVLQGKSVERVDVQMLGSGLYWINILLEDGRRAHLKWMKQ